jgi:hypothetical protein
MRRRFTVRLPGVPAAAFVGATLPATATALPGWARATAVGRSAAAGGPGVPPWARRDGICAGRDERSVAVQPVLPMPAIPALP